MAYITESQTKTRQSRYGGFGSYSIYDEPEQETEQTSTQEVAQPSIFDFDDNTEYEVERNYSSLDEEAVETNDRVMSMPSVVPRENIQTRPVYEGKVKLRARAKIAITVYSIILACLISFAIYNAVAISNMNASIATQNQTMIEEQLVINELLSEYNNLGSDTTIRLRTEGVFVEPTESDIVRASKTQMVERDEVPVESNWFEDLCEFISELFSH